MARKCQLYASSSIGKKLFGPLVTPVDIAHSCASALELCAVLLA
jgi:hypothetical protein